MASSERERESNLKVNQERCASRYRALDALLGQKARRFQKRAGQVSQSHHNSGKSEALLTERLTSGNQNRLGIDSESILYSEE